MARIIMAEDDPVVAYLVRTLLEDAGHVVGIAPCGADISRVARDRRPDLLIVDCGLPTKERGLTVLRRLKAEGIVPRIPALVITERASKADRARAYGAGAGDTLCKPIDPDELVIRVETLLGLLARRA